MQGYEELYFTLFQAVTEAIELLKEAQQRTEDMYIHMEEDAESASQS
ncbi:MAG: hypothetical protein FWF10_01445 [Clostridiales bacterium]|nr:hypothetical protein [Clostridiales bacterium]